MVGGGGGGGQGGGTSIRESGSCQKYKGDKCKGDGPILKA